MLCVFKNQGPCMQLRAALHFKYGTPPPFNSNGQAFPGNLLGLCLCFSVPYITLKVGSLLSLYRFTTPIFQTTEKEQSLPVWKFNTDFTSYIQATFPLKFYGYIWTHVEGTHTHTHTHTRIHTHKQCAICRMLRKKVSSPYV